MKQETTTEEKSSRSYRGFVLWPYVIVVLYALSYGPALLLIDKSIIDPKWLSVYRPLWFTLDAIHLDRPFGVYMHLWCPSLYRRDGTFDPGI
jgi:hypothetical protein